MWMLTLSDILFGFANRLPCVVYPYMRCNHLKQTDHLHDGKTVVSDLGVHEV